MHLPLCKARRADYLFHCKAPRAFSQDVFTDSARKTVTFALRYDYNDICPSNAANAAAEGKALWHSVKRLNIAQAALALVRPLSGKSLWR